MACFKVLPSWHPLDSNLLFISLPNYANRGYTASDGRIILNDKLGTCRRKWPWPILRYFRIYLWRLRKTMRILCQNMRFEDPMEVKILIPVWELSSPSSGYFYPEDGGNMFL
jgi:hypothetical protein